MLALLIATVLTGQTYAAQCKAETLARIAFYESELERARQNYRGSFDESAKAANAARIRQFSERLVEIKKPRYVPPLLLDFGAARKGDIGMLPQKRFIVLKVIDKMTLEAETVPLAYDDPFKGWRRTGLAGENRKPYRIRITGFDTSSAIDGAQMDTPQMFELVGTTAPPNVYWELRPFTPSTSP